MAKAHIDQRYLGTAVNYTNTKSMTLGIRVLLHQGLIRCTGNQACSPPAVMSVSRSSVLRACHLLHSELTSSTSSFLSPRSAWALSRRSAIERMPTKMMLSPEQAMHAYRPG